MKEVTILHVEDNEDNRKVVRDLFEFKGYRVVEALNGEDGVRKAGAVKPDLILMDIQLPKMNGYEATRAIKSDPALKNIPILIITSYAFSGDDRKAYDAGADDYMMKPYTPMDLLKRVEAWIGKQDLA